MTLKQLLTSLRNRLQEPDSSGRYSNAELVDYLNLGCKRVCRDLKPILKSASVLLASGDDTAALPVDYLAFHSWTGSIIPSEGTDIVANLVIFPVSSDADVTLTLRYFALPTEMSSTVDPTGVTSEVPDRLFEGVILAAYFLALESDMDNRSLAISQDYQQWVSRTYMDSSNKHYDDFRIKVAKR